MDKFDKQFLYGLSFGSRTLMKLEAAVDKAEIPTIDKAIQKSKVVEQKINQFTRQKRFKLCLNGNWFTTTAGELLRQQER